jgi:hypothetical protein
MGDGEGSGREHGLALPPVFFNSIAKSGTHLLLQALSGVPGLRPYLLPPYFEGLSERLADDRARLSQVGPGGLAFGHVYYSPEWASMLEELGFAQVFLYRDPRDVVVSLMHYATRQAPDMAVLSHLSHCLHTDPDRLLAIITGFEHDGIRLRDIDWHFRLFLPWCGKPGVLSVQFEDLAGTSTSQYMTLTQVLRHIAGELPIDRESAIVAAMEAAINPATSGTFRRGTIGSWRDEFDQVTKRVFKAIAGDLVIELGYESASDW